MEQLNLDQEAAVLLPRTQLEIEQDIAALRAQRLGRAPVSAAEIELAADIQAKDRHLRRELSATLESNRDKSPKANRGRR